MSVIPQRSESEDELRFHRLHHDASAQQAVGPDGSPRRQSAYQFGEAITGNTSNVLQNIQNIQVNPTAFKATRSRHLPNPFISQPGETIGSAHKRVKYESSNVGANDFLRKLEEQQPPQLPPPPPRHQIQYETATSTATTTSDYDDIPSDIRDEIFQIEHSFPLLRSKYRIVDRIGEGTFSTVYKAEPLVDDALYLMGEGVYSSPENKAARKHKKRPYVALKRIYVTSSPQRILNELKLLFWLSGEPHVAPLLDAIREDDQIIAVLPYYEHTDFREFYRDLPLAGIKDYMSELLQGLNFVHSKKILHRDIKPTNFLYNPMKRKGVLVDFGLAEKYKEIEKESSDKTALCPCKTGRKWTQAPTIQKNGIRKNDNRGARRANRAGTRGFRAPEVLLKCPHQTTKIDIWSVGVILLTFLSRRFPFFNSRDDTDALVELTTIFGLYEMKKTALLHGLGIETTLDTLQEKYSLRQIIHMSLSIEREKGTLPDDSVIYDTLRVFDENGEVYYRDDDDEELKQLKREHIKVFEVMEACLKLDPRERASADQLLQMPFFENEEDDNDDMILMDVC